MGRSVVGLDLGSSGVRAVQLALGKGADTLEKAGQVKLPRGAIEGGELRDAETVRDALKELWAQQKFSTKQVAFGLSNNAVIVRQMDLDWMEPSDFKKALPYLVQDYMPDTVNDHTLDYHTLGEFTVPGEDGEPKRMARILLIAANRDMVNAFTDAVQQAGLLPIKADLVPFALIRGTRPATAASDTAEAIVDFGADVTNVVVHQGGQPRFVRIIAPHGGHEVTDALVRQFQWSFEDAEATKVNLGLPAQAAVPTYAVQDSVFGGVQPGAAAEAAVHPAQTVINQHMAAFIGEIRNTLDFFLSSASDVSSLTKVTLTGGGSQMIGLAQRLSGELRIPIEVAAPFQHLTPKKGVLTDEVAALQPHLSVATGLCLGVK